MLEFLLKSLKILVTRSIFIYMVFFLLVWRILDYSLLINNAVPQTLSRLTPPIDYFAEFVDRTSNYDKYKLMNCINYHQAVAHFYKYQKSEAYGMLGFCYERLGQKDQAIDSYQQAIKTTPDNFWPYYNLGVIYYNQGQYSKAQDYLYQAIEQSPVKTLFLISRSKVYNDVKLSMTVGSYDYIQGLKEGRIEAYALLMESLSKAGSFAQLEKVALNGLNEKLGAEGVFYFYAGLAAFNSKSLTNAVLFLKESVQHDPNSSDAYYYLGLCFRLAGRDDIATQLLAKADQLHQQGANSQIKTYLNARVRYF